MYKNRQDVEIMLQEAVRMRDRSLRKKKVAFTDGSHSVSRPDISELADYNQSVTKVLLSNIIQKNYIEKFKL